MLARPLPAARALAAARASHQRARDERLVRPLLRTHARPPTRGRAAAARCSGRPVMASPRCLYPARRRAAHRPAPGSGAHTHAR